MVYLLYLKLIVHASTTLAYSKWPCICLKVWYVYNMLYDIIFPELSTIFYYYIWLCDCVTVTDVWYQVMSIHNSGSQDKNKQKIK